MSSTCRHGLLPNKRCASNGAASSTRWSHGRNAVGMTMIEVVVAIAILGIMSFLAYGGVAISLRSQQHAQVLHERYHSARLFMGRIKRELSMSFLSLHQADDKHTVTIFDGERDRILFNTSSHQPIRRNSGESDQLEVEYSLGQDDDGEPSLIRRVKYAIDEQPGRGGIEEVVVSGVDRFELEYFDKEQEDWRSEWDVTIDDAIEKREALKLVLQARQEVAELENAPNTGLLEGARDLAAANLASKAIDKIENEVLDNLFLPSRVRIRLTLLDVEGRKYLIESQVELRVTTPLWY
jgi:prepilin-type N-terminal cleavage/methylation domain-containing protein